MKARGFTLIELMITVVIGTIALSAIGGTAWQVSRDHRVAARCERDLDEARAALAQLETDVRAAHGVTVSPCELVARGGDTASDVVWRFSRGALVRTAQGRSRDLAHGIAAFEVRADGPLVRLTLRLVPRSGNGRRAVLISEVAPRRGRP
jgi:prepilin-type N-terminal cleavage/methylation domain-containing protein